MNVLTYERFGRFILMRSLNKFSLTDQIATSFNKIVEDADGQIKVKVDLSVDNKWKLENYIYLSTDFSDILAQCFSHTI